MKYFKVLETAFINDGLRQPGEIVTLGDDVTEVGACLLPVDADGNELKAPAKKKKAANSAAEEIG